jgi:tetraacyldisaccharide 4'-kinase
LAAEVADRIMARRVAARRPPSGQVAVVSVGNLALGGTGKTPVVKALAAELAASGRQGAILTRGFGSPLSGPLHVEHANLLAGDEARLMAAATADHGWPVIQARRRQVGLDHILDHFPGTEIVIVEDGHQTAGLGRHLDVVILDSWTLDRDSSPTTVRPVTGPVVPFGPWRESAAGAGRADIWLLESSGAEPLAGQGGQAVATFQREMTLVDPRKGTAIPEPTGRLAVLSGIARPGAFEGALGTQLGADPSLAIRCGDHARYAPRMVADIVSAIRRSGSDYTVTTTKDWVKLQPFWPQEMEILVVELRIVWGNGKTLPELVEERLEAVYAG